MRQLGQLIFLIVYMIGALPAGIFAPERGSHKIVVTHDHEHVHKHAHSHDHNHEHKPIEAQPAAEPKNSADPAPTQHSHEVLIAGPSWLMIPSETEISKTPSAKTTFPRSLSQRAPVNPTLGSIFRPPIG